MNQQNSFKKVPPALWLLLPALLGMAAVAYATTWGPGVGGDATIYITAARNFASGKGLGWIEPDGSFRLLPYTPPFYPLVLSVLAALRLDVVAGARWLNVLFFGLTLAGCSWALYRLTRRPMLAALISGWIAVSPVILGVEVWAMSESLFLLLGTAGLLLLADEKAPSRRRLALTGLLLGLALLTRYMGVAYLATACLFVLLLTAQPFKRRLSDSILLGLVGSLPMLAWLVIDLSFTGTVSSRSSQPALALWQRFLEMGRPMLDLYLFWWVPSSLVSRLPQWVQQMLLWLPLLAGGLLLGWFYRRQRSDPESQPLLRLGLLLGLLCLVYLAVTAGVYVFTYPPITLANRMLSPVHLSVLLFVGVLAALGVLTAPQTRWSKPLPVLIYLCALALFGIYGLRGALVVRDNHNLGIGYTSPAWQNSPTVQALAAITKNNAIVTNEVTAVMFLTGRSAYNLNELYLERPLETYTTYGAQPGDPGELAFQSGAALVLFSTIQDQFGTMYGEKTAQRLEVFTRGLTQVYDGPDGKIYYYPEPVNPNPPCCRRYK